MYKRDTNESKETRKYISFLYIVCVCVCIDVIFSYRTSSKAVNATFSSSCPNFEWSGAHARRLLSLTHSSGSDTKRKKNIVIALNIKYKKRKIAHTHPKQQNETKRKFKLRNDKSRIVKKWNEEKRCEFLPMHEMGEIVVAVFILKSYCVSYLYMVKRNSAFAMSRAHRPNNMCMKS